MTLCNVCHDDLPAPGLMSCAPCRERARDNLNRLRADRRTAKKCLTCGEQARPGKTMCAPCAKKRVAEVTAYQRAKLARGICTGCSEKLTPQELANKKQHCVTCREKMSAVERAWRADRVAKGLCLKCDGLAREGRQMCAICAARIATRDAGQRSTRRVTRMIANPQRLLRTVLVRDMNKLVEALVVRLAPGAR